MVHSWRNSRNHWHGQRHHPPRAMNGFNSLFNNAKERTITEVELFNRWRNEQNLPPAPSQLMMSRACASQQFMGRPVPSHMFGNKKPESYKTVMCHSYAMSKSCPYGPTCWYAHGRHEIREPPNGNSSIRDFGPNPYFIPPTEFIHNPYGKKEFEQKKIKLQAKDRQFSTSIDADMSASEALSSTTGSPHDTHNNSSDAVDILDYLTDLMTPLENLSAVNVMLNENCPLLSGCGVCPLGKSCNFIHIYSADK